MEMFAHCAGILLLVLHAADSQGNEVKTIEVPLGGTVNISCGTSALARFVTWYKEGQNKNLCKIDQDDNKLKGEQKCTPHFCNLIINNAQRNVSGTYTCVVSQNNRTLLMHRTRVIITETLKPTLSILGPSFLQDGPLKHDIPLLCTVFNVNPNSNTVIWNISGKIYQDKMDVDMIDGKGAFSIWSLKLVPPEDWQSEMSYACSYPGNVTTGGVLKQEESQIKEAELSGRRLNVA
ncbi:uncharacterized protein LOC131196229 [Ahaetulla prasina]|uniref:uncharacterized protein LOC131196229 n=1 Tax=Ahaetulla prasina TaxID=499056 RepID=UPI0026477744|nr:uncharacterized protein LOC131196229 [Ahaetulla prasina]XP_058034747.1 uncharacterized protein LOC131196229 [Ahaetulla prasina]